MSRCPICDTLEHKGDCPTIIQLTSTSSGSDYRSRCRPIEPGRLDRVSPVMGVRLFYGLAEIAEPILGGENAVEFVMTGRGFATAERKARAIAPVLFEGTFASHRYEVQGDPILVTRCVDLTPVETTLLVIRVGMALR